MHTVDEALSLVLEQSQTLSSMRVPAGEALDLVLNEDITSDINSPPHDKSLVDGYAMMSTDSGELQVLEEVAAGDVPHRAVTPGTTIHIMTGAPIPEGADAVVMLERTERVHRNVVRILDPTISAGQNIMPLGTSMSRGEVVLKRGARIRAVEIGLLAEMGRTRVEVTPRPRVAVLATGNELVPASNVPAAGHLRNSNGPMLGAAVTHAGAMTKDLGMAPDDRDELSRLAGSGFDCDVLLLSGGVSAGVLDLVPQVLAELDVRNVFHKVSLRPGKPLWFGVKEATNRKTLVFGLPGNPVSALVCFELFVRPALNKLAARTPLQPIRQTARLAADYHHQSDRETFHPARQIPGEQGPEVALVPWRGSGDLAALATADVLVAFPAGDHFYAAGDEVATLAIG